MKVSYIERSAYCEYYEEKTIDNVKKLYSKDRFLYIAETEKDMFPIFKKDLISIEE